MLQHVLKHSLKKTGMAATIPQRHYLAGIQAQQVLQLPGPHDGNRCWIRFASSSAVIAAFSRASPSRSIE
jgi:hypothetical protein